MSSSRPRRAVAMARRKYTEAEESSEAEHSQAGNGDFSGDDEGVARNTKTRKTLQTSSQPRAKRARLRQPQPEQSSSSPGTSLNRPNSQTQSRLLTLPMELVDKILGDPVLNERDHLALSGTCTSLRLGYDESVWEPWTKIHTPFAHNCFTYQLLQDPCNASKADIIEPEDSDKKRPKPSQDLDADGASSSAKPYAKPPKPTARIWTRAMTSTVKPGIDFQGPCYKARHKKCKCIRLHGPAHSKVISNVNLNKTAWGAIYYHYQGLAEYVNKRDFSSVRRSNTRGEPADWYRLATVDAAILNAVGGVVAARKVTRREEGQKRRKMPKDESEDESEPEDPYIILARGLLRASTAFGAIERKR